MSGTYPAMVRVMVDVTARGNRYSADCARRIA